MRQIYTALDGAGNRPRNVFFTDTQLIYCDVVWSGVSNDETVTAQLIQISGEPSLYDGSNNTNNQKSYLWSGGESVPGTGNQTVAFSFNPPTAGDGGSTLPYAVGKYKCLISVNGSSAGEADFEVQYPSPDCPASGGAYDTMPCVAYANGAQCPVDSNYQTNGTQCTCQPAADPLARAFSCTQ